jgi:large subunit ribosomal protein L18
MALRTTSRDRQQALEKRQARVRRKISGSAERPRLAVHRSHRSIQGQLTNDLESRVLLGVSTLSPELKELRESPEGTKTALARAAGKLLAEKAKEAGVTRVVFDRGGYLFHGRIAAFAEGAREGGLEF